MKVRVKCVNCGMVYDIYPSTWNDENNLHGKCTKCGSNAWEKYNENEWEAKLVALQKEFDEYTTNAETAVRVALNQNHNTIVSIGENGEVRRIDGRSDRIQ